jgi:hypothetical protein
MNKLTNLLLKAQQPSKFGTDQKFIPKGILEHLIDREMVELILGKKEEEEDLRDFVLEKATMLLALAALSGIKKSEIHEAMKAFMDANIEDSHLPLDEESLNRIATDDDNSDDEGVWSVATKYHFRNTQPKFLAPVFDLSRHNHDFPSSAILPFIKEAKALGQGTFGEVYKYGIHPAHMIKGTDEKHPEYQVRICCVNTVLTIDQFIFPVRNLSVLNLSLLRRFDLETAMNGEKWWQVGKKKELFYAT